MQLTAIGVKKYKLFENVRIDKLEKVNVIIGKNNCGKSSLLDIIGAAYSIKEYKNDMVGLVGVTPVTMPMIKNVFSVYSGIGRWNFDNYSKVVMGKELELSITSKRESYINENRAAVTVTNEDQEIKELREDWNRSIGSIENKINNTIFRRLSAERDIVPEMENDNGLNISGEGASNLIRKILNNSECDESIIEIELLDALNYIMYPEAVFEGIRIQQIKNSLWEVFLQEKDKPRIPLSGMGSGLKTIILMLLNLLIIPKMDKKTYSNIVYGFEELENNLHPAMQRKVFEYIYRFAIENDVTILLRPSQLDM